MEQNTNEIMNSIALLDNDLTQVVGGTGESIDPRTAELTRLYQERKELLARYERKEIDYATFSRELSRIGAEIKEAIRG